MPVEPPVTGRARSISLQRARGLALAAIGAVVVLQAINSFGCYHHDLPAFGQALAFIALPMLPALVALFTRNPLRSVAASALFAPWLLFAYYTDCIRPYQGGGASMVYVAVLMYGFATALLGAVLAGWVLRRLGIAVVVPPRAG